MADLDQEVRYGPPQAQTPRPPSNARPTCLPSTWGLALRLRLTYKYIDSGICVSGPDSLVPGCKYRRTCTHLKMTIGFGMEKCAKALHKSRQFPAKMSITGELKLAIYALSDLPSVMTTSPLPTPPLHSFSKLPLDLVELLQAELFALTKFVASKSLVFDAGRRDEATELASSIIV